MHDLAELWLLVDRCGAAAVAKHRRITSLLPRVEELAAAPRPKSKPAPLAHIERQRLLEAPACSRFDGQLNFEIESGLKASLDKEKIRSRVSDELASFLAVVDFSINQLMADPPERDRTCWRFSREHIHTTCQGAAQSLLADRQPPEEGRGTVRVDSARYHRWRYEFLEQLGKVPETKQITQSPLVKR
jgi:hypothetical protein